MRGNKTFKEIILILSLQFGSFLFLYPLAVILARNLGAENYGAYGFIVSLSTVLVIIFSFGSDQFLTKKIVNDKVKGLFNYLSAIKAFIIISAVFSVFFIALSLILSLFNIGIHWSLIAISVPFLIFRKLLVGLLRAFDKTIVAKASEVIVQPAFALFFALVLYYFDLLSLVTATFSLLISYLLSFMYGVYYLKNEINIKSVRKKRLRLKYWLHHSLPFLGMTISNVVITHADRIMIAQMHSFSEAGVYIVAARNAAILLMCFGCIQFALGPKIAKYRSSEKEGLQLLATKHVLLLFGLGSAVFIFLVLVSNFLVSIFGEEFIVSREPLLFLLCSYLFTFLFGSPVQYLYLQGEARVAFNIVIVAMLINLLLNGILIPFYGAMGASVATALCLLFKASASSYILYKRKSIRTDLVYALQSRLK